MKRTPASLHLMDLAIIRANTALPVIRVPDIAEAYKSVVKAGGTITLEIFDFPGGRRFHFDDPEGQPMAVYQPATD